MLLFIAMLSSNMSVMAMLCLAVPHSTYALAGPSRPCLVDGYAAVSPYILARLSCNMPCGGHATVGSTAHCQNVCMTWPDFV